MATKNTSYARRPASRTHEGAPAKTINAFNQLKRSVLACLLWEDTFYESGEDIGTRISDLVQKVTPAQASQLAEDARTKYHLRHVPLWLSIGMKGPHLKTLLPNIIQRPDELTEWLALYWKDGKKPIPAAAKKGLRIAFEAFGRYQLAKYKMESREIKLVDIMKLVHPKPSPKMAKTYKELINGDLKQFNTWENKLSTGEKGVKKTDDQKREAFEALIHQNKLGGMAVIRNLRNLEMWNTPTETVRLALKQAKFANVLPFRFVAAAQAAPRYEPELEEAMFRSLSDMPKLKGRTVLLVDVSGSMDSQLAGKSEMKAYDAAASMAMLLREIADELFIYSFSYEAVPIPNRRGFALRDAIVNSQPHGGTNGGQAIAKANEIHPDRIIMITDEQFRDRGRDPHKLGYMINVRNYQNGVGYGKWTHLDGWSDYLVRYIQEVENVD